MKKILMALAAATLFAAQPSPAEAHEPVGSPCIHWTAEYRIWNGYGIITLCRDIRTSQPTYYAPRYTNRTRNYHRHRSHTHRSRSYHRPHRKRHVHRRHRR